MKQIYLISLIVMSLSFNSCNNRGSSDNTFYEGSDISGIADITRDKNTRETIFTIETNGKWKLYAGDEVKSIDHNNPVLEGEGSGRYSVPVSATRRNYFQLVTTDGKAILAERHLPMNGGFNFRDLGGIKNKDGRFTKWGKIFRADDLHSLTDNDLDYLSTIPLITIVDFRSEEEIRQAPDRVPSSVREDHAYSITPGNLTASATDLSSLSNLNLDSVMISINKLLVTDSSAIARYKDFFGLLQNKDSIPLLFHCTAGKDRTGMGAALILYALNVDDNRIIEDYLLSNTYLKDKYAAYINQYPSLEPLFGVKPAYLQAGIDQIRETYGSIDDYLQNTLQVDLAKFREMYLY